MWYWYWITMFCSQVVLITCYDYRESYMRGANGPPGPKRGKCQLEIACRDGAGAADSSMVRLPIRGPQGPLGPPGMTGERGIAGEPGKPGIPELEEVEEEGEEEEKEEEPTVSLSQLIRHLTSPVGQEQEPLCHLQLPHEDTCEWSADSDFDSSTTTRRVLAIDPLEWKIEGLSVPLNDPEAGLEPSVDDSESDPPQSGSDPPPPELGNAAIDSAGISQDLNRKNPRKGANKPISSLTLIFVFVLLSVC